MLLPYRNGAIAMLKYLEEVCALIAIILCIACVTVWGAIIDHHVRIERAKFAVSSK